MIIPVVIAILLIIYGILVLYYWQSWKLIPEFVAASHSSESKISVIIPARNEEQNISNLLTALQKQSYPANQFEVIVIDDHSSDDTANIVNAFPGVKLVELKEGNINSYKKKAIETGIAVATGDLIVTTDADCVPPGNWLQTIAAFREKHKSVLIAAPVVINANKSVLQIFQAMDFMVLQGITGAVVHNNKMTMCNGANLAYERSAFYDVNGFADIDNIASGDDMLLMHKIATKYPGRTHYLKSKNTIVSTQAAQTWKEFFSQRIRWASKAARFDDKRILPVLVIVYLVNLVFLAMFIAGFWNTIYWIYLIAGWAMKTLLELPLFLSVTDFFGKKWANKLFFFFQPLHILYTIMSGLFGQFGKYEWKGRKVS